jgi:hypothetical protein
VLLAGGAALALGRRPVAVAAAQSARMPAAETILADVTS